MHRIINNVSRPEKEIVDQFQNISTPILSDVTTKYANTMDSGIKPVHNTGSVVGTALTAKVPPGDNLIIHKLVTVAEPGDLLVIDANGYTEAGIWGELLSISAKSHDIAGTIIDGAVRDTEDIESLDYPVYARETSPKGSYKHNPGSINIPISCGGTTVNPGDIVVGDSQGIVIIDPEHAEKIHSKSEEKIDSESEIRQQASEGVYIYDIIELEEEFSKLNIDEIN